MALPALAIPLMKAAAIAIGTASIGSDIAHTVSNYNKPNNRKRRGPSDYEPTSFTLGMPEPIQPIQPVHTLSTINLNTLQPLQTIKPLKPLGTKRTLYKNAEFNEFTDPLEVNSISDVLFNQEGRNIIMEDLGLSWVDDIPVLGSIAETVIVGTDMIVNKYAKPTLNGEFGKALVTGLNGLGEDLDFIDLANTVKGFVIEKDKSKVLSRSLGFGSEGKYNYNYDTGSGWKDFGLEVISSPGTWITVVKGMISSGVKSMAKTALKESAERIAKETGADLTSEAMQSFIKRAGRVAIDSTLDSKAANEAVQKLLSEYVATSVNKNSVEFSQQFLKQFSKDMTTVAGSKMMSALRVIKPLDEVNDALSAVALKTYLTGGTYPILRKTYDPIITSLKNATLNGLSKVTKKGVDVLSAVLPKDDTILDLTKVVDNATIKEITEAQFRTTKMGRLKYGDSLDFLKGFGSSEEFDQRLIGMIRGIKDTDIPEEKFALILEWLEEDVKLGKVTVDVDLLRTSEAFKDFVIGTTEEAGYILKTASALDAVQDALNKNFKYVRRDILNDLSGAKTNLDAFVRLENYFKEQGMTLKEMLEDLDRMISDPTIDSTLYLEQKEFIEALMDELGFNRSWLSEDAQALGRAVDAIKGETPDEIFRNVLKETEFYTVRGKELIGDAEVLFKTQKRIYRTLSDKNKFVKNLYDMLGDTTLTQIERNALDQVIKALEGDSPMNDLFRLMDVLTGTSLEGTFVYDNLARTVSQLQEQIEMAVAHLDNLEQKYINPVSEYARNPYAGIDNTDYTPDGVYKRLKDLNFNLKGLGKEDLETAKYLKKLTDQPNIIKVFESPIKPTELGKSLDKIIFKNSEKFFEELKSKGVIKNVVENLSEADLEMILNKVNEGGYLASDVSPFEDLQNAIMKILYADGDTEDLLDAAFRDESITNMPQIIDAMREVNAYYDKAVIVKEQWLGIEAVNLAGYMDSIENLMNEISSAVNARSYKTAVGEQLESILLRRLEELQSKLQENYIPLFEYVNLAGDNGKVYRLKLLQFFNRIENINKLRDTIYQGQSTLDIIIDIAEGRQTIIGGLIDAIANGDRTDLISDNFRTMARQIQNKAQSTVNYLKLQEAIYGLDSSHGLNDALMDWLENFNRKQADNINITRQDIEDALIERTSLGKATGIMKLENYYDANVKQFYGDKLRAHNAIDDRIMQQRVLQYQMNKGQVPGLTEGKTVVLFDLETTGLSIKQAELGDADIVQISAARYQVKNGELIQVGESFEVYGKPRRELTTDIKQLVGQDVVDEAMKSTHTTQDVVQMFKEFVGNDAIGGHNVLKFDIPYLNAVSNYEVAEVFDSYEILRNTEYKSILHSDDNIAKFTQYVEDSYNIIEQYIIKQQAIKMPFIYTIDKYLADDLYNLFNPLDYQLQRMDKRGLNVLSSSRIEDARSYILGKADSSVDYSHKNLPEGADTMEIKDGTSMIQTLRQGLVDTKNTNKELANWYITTDALQKEFGTTNIVAVLHGMQDGRYVDEFLLNKYGVRTMWKPTHINILNNLPENINVGNAAQLEKFRTTLDRVYERIYNNHATYTVEQMSQMKNLILQDFSDSVWLKYTNLDSLSMYEMWALYQTLGFYNIKNGVLLQAPNYDIAKGIMSNVAVRDDIKKSILYVDDVRKLQNSYDILADPLSSNQAVEDAISDILANGDSTDTMRAIAYMEREYTSFVKDAGTFDEDWYARVIRKDFETNYTVLGDARKVVAAKESINPSYYYQYQLLNKQRYVNHTKSVLGLTPQSLTKYMHEHGYITYLKGSDLGTFADDIARIVDNKKIYNDAGISFKQTDDSFIIYLNKNYENSYADMVKDVKYETSYHGVVDKTQLDESMLNYLDAFEKNDLRIRELDANPFDAYNSVYNKVDGTLHHNLIKDIDLPDLVSQAYKEDFYTRVVQIDFPALGTVESIRSVHKYAVTDMVNAQVKELNRSLKLSGARNKYIQFLFNDDYTLKRNALWDKLSDEQILNTLKGNKNLSAVVLYEKDGKIMARKVSPTTVAHVQSIRNLNGAIFPTDMANKITGTINEYDKILKEKHPILYKWREYVVSTYKTLYLTSLGFLFRNQLDILIKNTATIGDGPVALTDTFRYNLQAWKLWDNYSKTVAQIMGSSDNSLTEFAIDNFFKNHPELDRRMFEFVHRYATSSASAGMAKAQQEAVKSFNLSRHSVKTNLYKKAVYENHLVKGLMNVNANIEHAGRLGLLLQSIEEGKVFDDAIQDVLRTHFDYSNLSYAELVVEYIIPFITFPLRNLEYWGDALKGNMWLVELMADATMETNQLHSQTQFMIDNSSSLQNDINNGNLRVMSSVIKTSPSAFDAARLLLTPADMKSNYSESDFNKRIIAPLRVPRQEDIYGNVNDNVTKMNEYLRNVLAVYQIERPLTVAGNLLGINGGNVDNLADVIPSIVGERNIKPGNMTGDMKMYQNLPSGMSLQSIIGAGFRQDADAERITTQVNKPKQNKVSRAGYSKQRIPYVKRYYSSSYNFYNRWKAQSYTRKSAMRNMPPTPESLEGTIRNVFFSNNITPLKMNYLQYKQRASIR